MLACIRQFGRYPAYKGMTFVELLDQRRHDAADFAEEDLGRGRYVVHRLHGGLNCWIQRG